MIYYVVPRLEDFTIREHLEAWGREDQARISIVHYEDLPERRELPTGTYLFSALDHLTPRGEHVVCELADQLSRAGSAVRVVNSPTEALRRFDLLSELHRLGFNTFRAARAAGDLEGLRYPVFVREERWHSGALSALLRTPAELEAGLARAIVRGHRLSDLLVVEFADTADSTGTYRKYAAFVVGSAIMARSLAVGRHWMLKHQGSDHAESTYLEQRAYVFENPHENALRKVFDVAGIAYGRIDYSMKDGAPVVWEINLNPVIGRGLRPSSINLSPPLRSLMEEAKRHFYPRFRAALDSIEVAQGPRPIPVHIETSGEAAGPMTFVESPYRWAAVRRALRPARPLIDRIAGAVSPLLIRASRAARAHPRS